MLALPFGPNRHGRGTDGVSSSGSSSKTGHPLTRRLSRPLRRRGASETRSRWGVEHFALFACAMTTRINLLFWLLRTWPDESPSAVAGHLIGSQGDSGAGSRQGFGRVLVSPGQALELCGVVGARNEGEGASNAQAL
jgi:hypothetical protein